MTGIISEADYAIASLLFREGALEDVQAAKIPRSGWIFTHCGDGEETPEAIHNLNALVTYANGSDVCAHLAPWDGGPAGLSTRSPFHHLTRNGVAVANALDFIAARMEWALLLKGDKIRNWGGIPHCPCGLCSLTGVSLWENLRFSIEGKDALRREFGTNFEHYKIFPRINFTGYPEGSSVFNGRRNFVLHRKIFESLWDKHQ